MLQTNEQRNEQTKMSPCVQQDVVLFEAAAQKVNKLDNWRKDLWFMNQRKGKTCDFMNQKDCEEMAAKTELRAFIVGYTGQVRLCAKAFLSGVYIVERLLILFPPPAFNFLPYDASRRITKSLIFFPPKL